MARKYASQVACGMASSGVTGDNRELYQPAFQSELRYQGILLRELFANPFRPVTFGPAWRTSSAVELARTIYQNRAFERMPELAGALEEAGCTDPDILGHCRGPREHVRGCWVVDLLLGKG
jgi:hypothetical protein